MRRAALIFNPKSGRQTAQRLWPQLESILRGGGFDVEPLPTAGPGDATRLARRMVDAGDREVVFALGGDGTLREVASGLVGSDVALGPIPGGTANVLTLALDIPRKPLAAAAALADGHERQMDVGTAGEHLFLMMVSGGLDARVMSRQNSDMKRRFGALAVAFSGLKHWWRYPYQDIELRIEGEPVRVTFFSASNIRQYGGPFRLAPEADYADGMLDVVLFRGRGRWVVPLLALDIFLGRHLRRKDLEIRKVQALEILGPLPDGLQVDGDVLRVQLPVPLDIRPGALKVLTPKACRSS